MHCICVATAAIAPLCAERPTAASTPQTPPPQVVAQQNGKLIALPMNTAASRKSGLSIIVNTRWADGYGYRPVEVSVQSPKPATTDRVITIRLHSGVEGDMCAVQDVELPMGKSIASAIVALPMYEQLTTLWWDVWVDGVKDLELCLDAEDSWQAFAGSVASGPGTLQILVAASDSNHQSLISPTTMEFEVLSWKLSAFPQRWIDYSTLDVVSLSLDELLQLAQINPPAFEAIGRWTRAGGQLWISDAGNELEQLPLISKLLGVPEKVEPLPAPVESIVPKITAADPADRASKERELINSRYQPSQTGWMPARFGGITRGPAQAYTDLRTGRTRWVSDPRMIAALDNDRNFAKNGPQITSGDENQDKPPPNDLSHLFVEQGVGFGAVRAFRGSNESSAFARRPAVNTSVAANASGPGQIPVTLAIAAGSTRHWETRHGVLPDATNSEFAKFLVPEVGRVPVFQFQILITLFVLLIGPINYWLLKRYKRMQLLVLTVPLTAGFATFALFAYAVASDGLSSTVRARSLTMLDQRNGEAACWSWLSYYSGMAPGKGLAMHADTVAYPIWPNWSTAANRAIDREIIWNENDQNLKRGWLSSRTPTQYLTIRARKTPHKIDIVSGAGKLQVTNRLDAQIIWLVVNNEEGRFFTGGQLASGTRMPLRPIAREDAGKRFAELEREHPPEAPADLSGGDRDYSSRRTRIGRRRFGPPRVQPSGEPLMGSLASQTIMDLAGLNGRPALELPPRSYVAVTATGPEVEIGIPNAREEASFHVIVGRW